MHDVIVVGAGPGGSTAARHLAGKGLDVLIVDEATFPRDKPCGGIATPGVVDLVGEEVLSIIEQHSRVCRFLLDMEPVADYNDSKLMFRRTRFDELLLHLARRAGASVREGARVASVDLGDPDHAEVVLRDGERIPSRCVVGADGAYSAVARSCGLVNRHMRERRGNFALYVEADVTRSEADAILGPPEELRRNAYFFEGMYGAGWAFRNEGTMNIGIGVGVMGRSDVRKRADRLLDDLGLGRCKPGLRGEHIPCEFPPRVTTDRVLLVGDAAGAGNPATGCGIEDAIKTGILAAKVLGSFLPRGLEPTAQRLQMYDTTLVTMRRLQSSRAMAVRLVDWIQRRGWGTKWWMTLALKAVSRFDIESYVWSDANRFY